MRIAITGKIASGKSFISQYLRDTHDFKIFSFARPIKDICNDIFGMEYKDRKLLQQFAEKCKEIDRDVWVKYLERDILKETGNIVIDDLRFPNESVMLRKHGFKIIKLELDEEMQTKRIKETYPDTYKEHLQRITHISESMYDHLPHDYKLDINNDNSILNKIEEIIFFI